MALALTLLKINFIAPQGRGINDEHASAPFLPDSSLFVSTVDLLLLWPGRKVVNLTINMSEQDEDDDSFQV